MTDRINPQNPSQTAQQGGENQAANPGFEPQGQGAMQGQGTEVDENRLNAQGRGQESGADQQGGEGAITGQAASPDQSIFEGGDPTGGATDPSQINRATDIGGGQGEGTGGSAATGEERSFADRQDNNFDDKESLEAGGFGNDGDQDGLSQQNIQDR